MMTAAIVLGVVTFAYGVIATGLSYRDRDVLSIIASIVYVVIMLIIVVLGSAIFQW